MKVRLTDGELELARVVTDRFLKSGEWNPARHGAPTDPAVVAKRALVGFMGEIAFAKAADVYYDAFSGQGSAGDVGRYEVRATTRPDGRLILHREDPDRIFVLVRVAAGGRCDVVGWIPAAAARVKKFWHDPDTGRPAFFVPADYLAPIERLPGRRWTLSDAGLPPIAQVQADRQRFTA